MKKLFFFILLAPAIIACEDQVFETYIANVPVYMSFDEFRSSIQNEAARDLEKPGKIYFYNNYIFINEYMEGIHIINNTNPSLPQNIGFIKIPGNVDIAIKDDILYADSYVDLITVNIADLNNITVVGRLENVFPYTLPPFDEKYRVDQIDQSKGIVTGWEQKKVTREVFEHHYPVYPMFETMDSYTNGTSGHSSGATSFGVGGSMARFTCTDNALYAINSFSIMIVNTEDPSDLSVFKSVYSGWDIETLFPSGDNLFVGTRNGMLIYDISDEFDPIQISQYWHITSCDPVVIEGDYAYVTLRSGNFCGETSDRLDVIDISNLSSPVLVKSYAMTEPYGLGIDNNTLFICDGDAGLKIYDATDPLTITNNLIEQFSDIQAYDVIPLNGVLMLIGEDGFYQYSYSDLHDIQLLSSITVMN